MSPVCKRLVVIAPGNCQTGGVELLHQLVHTANAVGVSSSIAYHPLSQPFPVPPAYKGYRVDVLENQALLDGEETVLVVPEVLSYLLRHVRKATRFLWWLSVDNYLNSRSLRYALANRFIPYTYYDVSKRPDSVRHLAQSKYAASYLADRGIEDVTMLGDFINDEYLEYGRALDIGAKDDLIAYNPAKGFAQTRQLLPNFRGTCKLAALSGLTREGVLSILQRAKVYIDFGNHPGKDRFPREAAALGCCVVTNRRGSAANDTDVPIDPMYKIDDRSPDFVARAVGVITDILNAFPTHHERFANYRRMIAEEKTTFATDVRKIFSASSTMLGP